MTTREGFSAECHDCPTMIGEDYGQTIYTGVVSIDASVQAQVEVVEWARIHALVHEGHQVRVTRYVTFDVGVDTVDPEIWKLFSEGA